MTPAAFPGLVLVSGLGRCGTSLTMQMLAAGGWPVWGADEATWPAFEHPANLEGGGVPVIGAGILKWLDPHHFPPPPFYRAIFLTRDLREQARSQRKLGAMMGQAFGETAIDMMPAVDELAAYMRQEERRAQLALAERGPVLSIAFEFLVANPRGALATIDGFVGAGLDVHAGTRQLRPRSTGAACLPTMEMEETMIRESMNAGAA
jgi:hypothetical protein